MRGFAIAAAAGAALASTAFAQETDQARPGGVYATVAAQNPQACARACESDSLCMAWTQLPQQGLSCELKAVIPPARFSQGATSGLSSRAPRLARLIPLAPAPAPTPIAAPQEAVTRTITPVEPPNTELLGAPDSVEPMPQETPQDAQSMEVVAAEPMIGDGLGGQAPEATVEGAAEASGEPAPQPALVAAATASTQPRRPLPPGELIVPDVHTAPPAAQAPAQPEQQPQPARPSAGLRFGR